MRQEIKEEEKLIVTKIRNGVVLDHITPGYSTLVLQILGISCPIPECVILAANVESQKMGKKDIIKIVGKEKFKKSEIDMISIIAPEATISTIKNFKKEKRKVTLPALVEGLITCQNDNCITNYAKAGGNTSTKFILVDNDPTTYRCYYCDQTITLDAIVKNMTKRPFIF